MDNHKEDFWADTPPQVIDSLSETELATARRLTEDYDTEQARFVWYCIVEYLNMIDGAYLDDFKIKSQSIMLLIHAGAVLEFFPDEHPPKRYMLSAALAFPDRFPKYTENQAFGYVIERMVIEGNVWERKDDVYEWLGANYKRFAHLAPELANRKTVDPEMIETLLGHETALLEGIL